MDFDRNTSGAAWLLFFMVFLIWHEKCMELTGSFSFGFPIALIRTFTGKYSGATRLLFYWFLYFGKEVFNRKSFRSCQGPFLSFSLINQWLIQWEIPLDVPGSLSIEVPRWIDKEFNRKYLWSCLAPFLLLSLWIDKEFNRKYLWSCLAAFLSMSL